MEDRQTYEIKDICLGIYEGPHATPKVAKTGGIYLGIPALTSTGHINYDNIRYISDEDMPLWTKRVTPQEGDIVFTNEATLNLYALIPPRFYGCLGRRLGLIRPNKDIVDVNYLFYYFFSPEWRETISKNKVSGATVERILMTKFPHFPISLPSLSTQQKISKILSTIDAKIENNRKINDNLEQQAQALYKSWFVDFGPFKDREFVESEIGEIPTGWTVVKFGDLTKIPKKTLNPQRFPDTIFKHYSLPACDNGLIPETQTGKDIMSNKIILQNNTTLFSKLNPRIKRIWFTCEVQANSICSTEFIPYRAKNETESGYIFSIINSAAFYASVMGCVNGATGSHQRFHAEDTEDFLCAYNKEVVNEFSEHIDAILKQMHDLRQENVKLALMRDTLLPKLMSGELKINEIDC